MADEQAAADERRMTDAEGLMWRLEVDPTFSSSFATVTVLDRPADVERLRRRLARAVALVPRLRQRVHERPFGLPPVWADAADVDLDHHIRIRHLEGPGSMRQLLDLATEVLATPFDRTRPLWEFHIVDGVEDGKGAFIQKMHHTVTDGKNGLKISMQFLDVERHAPDPPPLTDEELAAAEPAPAPTTADAALEAMGNGVRFSTAAMLQVTNVLLDPQKLGGLTSSVTSRVRGTAATLGDTEKAHSTLWTQRSLARRIEALQVPLESVKEAAHRLDGTLNIAFLTASAAAAGAYHRDLGAPIESLRASMAISTRTKESGSNAFTLARLRVPTGEMTVAERFGAIKDATEAVRASAGSSSLDGLAAITGVLPTPLLVRLARQQSGTIDFATSNLRAAPFPLYFAGGRVLENYPVGPLAGVAFNLTLLSYCGSLDMGLHLDPAAVTEPTLLRNLLVDAFDELVTGSKPKRAKAAKKRKPPAKAAKAAKPKRAATRAG